MVARRDWSEARVRSACEQSSSYAQTLSALGVSLSGGGYARLKLCIAQYGIDVSHMTHQAWAKGKAVPDRAAPFADVLVQGSTYLNTHHLKKRLWQAGILDRRCYECGLTSWRGQGAPLQLDHINGVRSDNRLVNLRILCANCHALTDTWTGKNRLRAV